MVSQTRGLARVVIPTTGRATHQIAVDKVHSIVSNRLKGTEEQFLVKWNDPNAPAKRPPLSWHSMNELSRCLEHVQDYLEVRKTITPVPSVTKKRKSPEFDRGVERRSSPFDRQTNQFNQSTPISSSTATAVVDAYNGVVDVDEKGFLSYRSALDKDIPQVDIEYFSTPDILRVAQRDKIERANILIRAEYHRRLSTVPGKKIHLVNIHDSATPSLRFRYIPEYELREGVLRAPPGAQVGCQQCSPHMGRDIGCEYTKKCDCLEYAAVDESRITDPEMMEKYLHALATGGGLMGFPKKFPYYSADTKIQRAGCLVPFYLNSRRPIYECNDRCKCGPYCRNKNVQFGRTVELEIFRTGTARGWGLRCKQKLYEGQFIDTYRGEVISDAECTRRELKANKGKHSYLYSLDKFQEPENLKDEEIYVVDGEFMGGPTKFMNHSCEPNCRQYTVSYNKHDPRVYDIAFFACRDIPAGEELTFDYLDKEEGEDEEEKDEENGEEKLEEGAVQCLCGAKKCRKWLWT